MSPSANLSPILYLIIVALGLLAAGQYLALGGKPAPHNVRSPLIALLVTVTFENAYYGAGRVWIDIYDDLSWWWPGVLAFKLTYIFALAVLNLRLNNAR